MISLHMVKKCFQTVKCKYLKALYARHCSGISKKHENKRGKNKYKIVHDDILKQEIDEFMVNVDNHPVYSERKKAILSYIDTWRYMNVLVPDAETLTDKQWFILLTESYTQNKALAYLEYVLKSNYKKAQKKEMREQQKIENAEKAKENEQKPFFNFSVPIHEREKQIYNWNKLKAWKSEVPIVIDLNFEDCSFRELTAADEQIMLCLSENTQHLEPLNVHLTSVYDNIRISHKYQSDSLIPATFHERHFMDIFPHEELVYLSPDGIPMTTFDPSMTYIIGGVVDRQSRKRLTYSHAKEYGIKCYSLPLHRYVKLGNSAKRELSINTVFSIIQNMYFYNRWKEAFSAGLTSDKYTIIDKQKPFWRKYKR